MHRLIENWTIISQDLPASAREECVWNHTIGGWQGLLLRTSEGDRPGSNISMGKRLRSRLYAWWYFTIAAGFLLLGINRWLLGERLWLVFLRFGIAAGFLVLGYLTWKFKNSN